MCIRDSGLTQMSLIVWLLRSNKERGCLSHLLILCEIFPVSHFFRFADRKIQCDLNLSSIIRMVVIRCAIHEDLSPQRYFVLIVLFRKSFNSPQLFPMTVLTLQHSFDDEHHYLWITKNGHYHFSGWWTVSPSLGGIPLDSTHCLDYCFVPGA